MYQMVVSTAEQGNANGRAPVSGEEAKERWGAFG